VGTILDYGSVCKVNDTIGVLLEFKGGIASLSFYRNGTKLGIAFSNLNGTFYPTVCMFYGDIQLTLDPRASLPLN
jgi:hypothetical protein